MSTEIRTIEAANGIVGNRWRALYFGTIGAVGGFLGSVAILGAEVISSRLMGFAPFMLLRYYETIREGPAALVMTDRTFFLNAFVMHLAVGSALGAVFVLIAAGRNRFQRFAPYLVAGLVFGLAIWIVNFYFLLSWIQPLINGKAYILNNIPWWIAAGTHAIYGLTVALISYPFQNDVEKG